MTFLVERLVELRKHLAHLESLQSSVPDASALRQDLSLHNDVLFSLLTVCQLVIDIAGELSGRKGLTFDDYTESIRNLDAWETFDAELVGQLTALPGFRNILLHEYVAFDYDRAVTALHGLAPILDFVRRVAELEKLAGQSPAPVRSDPA